MFIHKGKQLPTPLQGLIGNMPPLRSLIGMPFITSVSFVSLIQCPISIIVRLVASTSTASCSLVVVFWLPCDVSTKKASTIEVWSLTFGAHSIADKVQSTLCYRETIIDSSTCSTTLVMFPRFTFVWCCRVQGHSHSLLVKREYKPSKVCRIVDKVVLLC